MLSPGGRNPAAEIDREFAIQGVRFLSVEECRLCYWMNSVIHFDAETMKGRGGLRAKIITDGALGRTVSPPDLRVFSPFPATAPTGQDPPSHGSRMEGRAPNWKASEPELLSILPASSPAYFQVDSSRERAHSP